MIANLAPITLVLVVLLSTLHHGEAIICYQCNSEYDPRCGDPFNSYSLGTVNCSFQPRLEHMSHLEPSLCRKISQKVTLLLLCGVCGALAGRRYLAIPVDGIDVIELSPVVSASRITRQTEAYVPVPVPSEELQARPERSAHILDYVDFGGQTGSNGAFSWFADYPAHH